jgi:drug/metabolite transporter (DMT)-like permease
MIPYYIWRPEFPSLDVLLSAPVFCNLIFLSIVASMICYLAWNFVIKHLGIVVATNWVYFNPITTILFAWWLLSEEITVWFLMGSALILIGMYMSDHYAIKKPEG